MVVIRTIHSLLSHVQLIIFNSDIPPYHDAKLFNIPLPLFPTFFPFLWHIFSFYLVLKCPKNVDCHFLLLVISYLCELMWAVYKIIKLMFRLTDRVMIHWLLSHRSHKTRLGFPLTKTWRHISIVQPHLSVWAKDGFDSQQMSVASTSISQLQDPAFGEGKETTWWSGTRAGEKFQYQHWSNRCKPSCSSSDGLLPLLPIC